MYYIESEIFAVDNHNYENVMYYGVVGMPNVALANWQERVRIASKNYCDNNNIPYDEIEWDTLPDTLSQTDELRQQGIASIEWLHNTPRGDGHPTCVWFGESDSVIEEIEA